MTPTEILAPYRDHNHLLLLMAPAVQSPAYEEQVNQFSGMEEECERHDLVLGHILYEGESRIGKMMLDGEQAATLRRRFGIESRAFLAVVVGKDGAVLRQFEAPVAAKAVFAMLRPPAAPQTAPGKDA